MSRVGFRRGTPSGSRRPKSRGRSPETKGHKSVPIQACDYCQKPWDADKDECTSNKSSCPFSPKHRCGQHCVKMDGHCGRLLKMISITSGAKGAKKEPKKSRNASHSTSPVKGSDSPNGSSRASSRASSTGDSKTSRASSKASTRESSRSPSPPKRLMSVPLWKTRPEEKKGKKANKSQSSKGILFQSKLTNAFEKEEKNSKRGKSAQSRSSSSNSRAVSENVSRASLGKKKVLLVGRGGGELFDPSDKRAQLSGHSVSPTIYAGGIRLGKDQLLVTGGLIGLKPTKKCEVVTFLRDGSVTVEKWAPLKKARWGHGVAWLDWAGALAAYGPGWVAVIGGAKGGRSNDIIRSVELWTGKRWEKGRAMKTSRSHFAIGKIQDKVLVASGQGADGMVTKLCEYYDPGQDQWHAFTDVSKGRMGVAGAAFNGRLWTCGGHDGPASMTNRVDAFDPLSGKWEEKAPMTSYRALHNLIELNGQLVALGGDAGGYNDKAGTVEVYDHRADAWRPTAHRVGPAPGSLAAVF